MMIRQGIRTLLDKRLVTEDRGSDEANREAKESFIRGMGEGPLVLDEGEESRLHFGLPPEFFREILGPRMKFSCCLFENGVTDLARAEEAMLAETCLLAGIEDGMEILELGCGWGALALWIAERYPACRVTAVTNSIQQADFITSLCAEKGIGSVRAVACDIKDFVTDGTFDRVVAVELFERLHNWRELMARISGWLRPEGKLFVHLFTHRRFAYPYEADGDDNWMGKYFFTGGMMPSEDLLPRFQDDMELENRWKISGLHYKKTADAWLTGMDRRRSALLPVMQELYGPQEGSAWLQRWRIFFMACVEMWGYRNGDEWGVCHYLFRRRA
jgi:cyclopropane-fatty-acyl-phospholipid synthase